MDVNLAADAPAHRPHSSSSLDALKMPTQRAGAQPVSEVTMLLREFKSRVDRPFRRPSARLSALTSEIKALVRAPSMQQLAAVRQALDAWQQRDPKEFANCGLPILRELDRELTAVEAICPRPGMITISDVSAHPRFDPLAWKRPEIMNAANCYAYACNNPGGHEEGELPQPGLLMAKIDKSVLLTHAASAGSPISQGMQNGLDGRHTLIRSRVDLDNRARGELGEAGLSRLLDSERPGFQPFNIVGHYLVALFVSADDFHWYRQDDTGYWSHKIGQGLPTDRGANGQRIRDPRDAPLQGYQCSGFYFVPKGGVRTASFPPTGFLTDEEEVVLRKAFRSAQPGRGHVTEQSFGRAGRGHSRSSSLPLGRMPEE